MESILVCGFTIFTVMLCVMPTYSKVITPPNNVTVRRGDSAAFTCDVSPSTDVMWSRNSPGLEVLYLSTKPEILNIEKYAIENTSSLVVKATDFSDGGTYSCIALGQESLPHYANLVIVDDPKASVNPPDMVSLGNNVTMTCLLNYSGPTHDDRIYPLSPDQDPRISIYFGGEDLTALASEVHVPGSAVQPVHSKALSLSRILTMDDIGKQLECYVHSIKPTYKDSISNLTLPFKYPTTRVTVDVGANGTSDLRDLHVYPGTLVNCSADGIPAPHVTWTPVGKNPSFEILRTEPGYSVLKLVGLGYHNWNCTASNFPAAAQAYGEVNLTVIGLPPKPVESKSASVGLGLGLGLGIPILLGVICLIIFLKMKRNDKFSRQGKTYSSQKTSLFGRKANSSGTEKPPIIYTPPDINGTRSTTNNGGINQNPNRSFERISDVPRSSDNPGYADLGVKTLGASGSMPHLNESFESMDERNFNRPPKSRNHSSFDDGDQFYPSRYHKVTTALNPDTIV